jgi:uncharacterized membrane protein
VAGLELLVHLPAVLVVAAVVHELTGVAEAAVARLFVVLRENNIVKIPSKHIQAKAFTTSC